MGEPSPSCVGLLRAELIGAWWDTQGSETS